MSEIDANERMRLVSEVVKLVAELSQSDRDCVLNTAAAVVRGVAPAFVWRGKARPLIEYRPKRDGRKGVKRVPGRRAEIIRLLSTGMSHDEIAAAVGITRLAVNSAVQYARRRGEWPAINGQVLS